MIDIWLFYRFLMVAAIETSVATLYWAMALMAEHPEVQTKAQAEIDRVVGRNRLPTIDDRGTLPYTEATLYEIMRYSSVAALGIPHATTKDTEFRKFMFIYFPFYILIDGER